MPDIPIITIMAGNPGSGKSTLLNSLAGKVLFRSGVSIGEGMTTAIQIGNGLDGKLYGDTPGLDDIVIRAQAAAEINKILRSYSAIKLCFVITLEAGRIKPADKATIEVILDALPPPLTNMFSIIINQVDKRVFAALQNPATMQRLLVGLNGKHVTEYIHIILLDESASNEDNRMLSNAADLQATMEKMPIVRYPTNEVKDIKHDMLTEIQENFAVQLEAIKHANKDQVDRMAAEHKDAVERAKADAEKMKTDFEARMDRMNEGHQQQLAVLQERVNAAKGGGLFGLIGRVIDSILPFRA
jgi:GTP-binding protein EngB required for normal cell division